MKQNTGNPFLENSILVLSLICPFMFAYSLDQEFPYWRLFAPIWNLGSQNGKFTVLLDLDFIFQAIIFIFPYLLIGYEFRRLMKHDLEDYRRYVMEVLLETAFSVLILIVPQLIVMSQEMAIPLPIVGVLALVGGWLAARDDEDEPW